MNNEDLVKAFIASKAANKRACELSAEMKHTAILLLCDKFRPKINKLIKFLLTVQGKVILLKRGIVSICYNDILLYDAYGVCYNVANFDKISHTYSERFGKLTNYYAFISSFYNEKKDIGKYIQDVYDYTREFLLQKIKEYDEETAKIL